MKDLTIAPRAGKRYLVLLEEAIGHPLPKALKDVLLQYAGLSIVENTFIDKESKDWEVQTFDNVASIISLVKEFKEKGWGEKIPFAYDPGGWHFCLSFDPDTNGKIVVNRWTDHTPEEQFVTIADSLEEFIDGLEPDRFSTV